MSIINNIILLFMYYIELNKNKDTILQLLLLYINLRLLGNFIYRGILFAIYFDQILNHNKIMDFYLSTF